MAASPDHQTKLSRRQLVISSIAAGATLLAAGKDAGSTAMQDLSAATPDDLLNAILAQDNPEPAIDALVEVFARSGIAVFDDAITQPLTPPAVPASPLSFQRSQLAPLVAELATGSSRPAGEYDALFPQKTLEGDVAPSVGELLVGYYGSAVSPGAAFSKAYFDRLLTDDLRIGAADLPAPAILISLLAGEILAEFDEATSKSAVSRKGSHPIAFSPAVMAFGQASGTSLPGLPEIPPIPEIVTAPLPPIEGSTICGMAQSFVSIVMQRIFSVLKAAEAVKSIPIIGGILGVLVEGVKIGLNVITKAVDALLAPVMGVIRAISAGLAVASMLIGTLSPWTVTLDLRPPRNRFGIDAEVVTGEIGIIAGGWDQIDFPPVIRECASLAGIQLPNPTSADAPVTLAALQSVPLITLDTPDLRLDNQGQATASYVTQNESADQAKGPQAIGIVWVSAVIEREDLKRLRQSLFDLLFSQLPDLIANIVRPLVGPVMDQLTDRLLQLVRVSGSQPLFVTYHEPPDEPDEEGNGDGGGTGGGCFPGSYILVDPFVVQRMYIPFPMEMTGSNTWDFGADGTVLITFNNLILTLYPDPSATFTFTFNGTQSGPYTTDGGVLSVQITENNAVMDTDMIALQGQITGPTPMTGVLAGPYVCGDPVSWNVSIPEVGNVTYEFVPAN